MNKVSLTKCLAQMISINNIGKMLLVALETTIINAISKEGEIAMFTNHVIPRFISLPRHA